MSRTKLLIVDDSAFNRRHIAEAFAGSADVEVVGNAADGEEALRLVTMLKPDVVTLDLEMPKMDGFTFLRLLMASNPIPVIVVSSYAQRENVFRALDLGAVDFIAKAESQMTSDATELKEQIIKKVLELRTHGRLRAGAGTPRSSVRNLPDASANIPRRPPSYLVAIASSTGGPTAILELFADLPANSRASIVIAQHMPDKFTRTFAERLDKKSTFHTVEAQGGETLYAQHAFVCPGRASMEIVKEGADYKIRIVKPTSDDRYFPSGDRLLLSVSKLTGGAGPRVLGVVLTGMGDDGAKGAKAIAEAGGKVIAESEETAVVFGMPGEVVRSGISCQVLPLPKIAEVLSRLV